MICDILYLTLCAFPRSFQPVKQGSQPVVTCCPLSAMLSGLHWDFCVGVLCSPCHAYSYNFLLSFFLLPSSYFPPFVSSGIYIIHLVFVPISFHS